MERAKLSIRQVQLCPRLIIGVDSRPCEDRAKRLLERFRTVRACFGASQTALLEVEGIGPSIAATIDQVIS